MHNAARYPFLPIDNALGEAGLQPRVPLTLTYQDQSMAVNVLPYSVGVDLGAVWEQQTTALRLTGNMAQVDARALLVSATIGAFAPVRLVFAWTQAPNVPVLLGQVNFFMEFDVCFYRSQLAFELRPKGAAA
jgi:hypothetical protein